MGSYRNTPDKALRAFRAPRSRVWRRAVHDLSCALVLAWTLEPAPALAAGPVITRTERRDQTVLIHATGRPELHFGLLPTGFVPAVTFELPLPLPSPVLVVRLKESGWSSYELEGCVGSGEPWGAVPGARLVATADCSILAPGSSEAQQLQVDTADWLGLPVETENSIGMRFRLVPAGSFLMGSEGSELGVVPDELPRHTAILFLPFWAGACEVTQEQYARVMGRNPSWFAESARNPVEGVTWNECREFIRRLNQIEGGGYRLLSETEWEYACRAGTSAAFCSGDTAAELDRCAWSWDNSDCATHPVGLKAPNAWGLHDMHGNVWEWVEDDYFRSYANTPADGTPWVREPRFWYRVMRGGCRSTPPALCRSATRFGDSPGSASYVTGFRLARDLFGE